MSDFKPPNSTWSDQNTNTKYWEDMTTRCYGNAVNIFKSKHFINYNTHDKCEIFRFDQTHMTSKYLLDLLSQKSIENIEKNIDLNDDYNTDTTTLSFKNNLIFINEPNNNNENNNIPKSKSIFYNFEDDTANNIHGKYSQSDFISIPMTETDYKLNNKNKNDE